MYKLPLTGFTEPVRGFYCTNNIFETFVLFI